MAWFEVPAEHTQVHQDNGPYATLTGGSDALNDRDDASYGRVIQHFDAQGTDRSRLEVVFPPTDVPASVPADAPVYLVLRSRSSPASGRVRFWYATFDTTVNATTSLLTTEWTEAYYLLATPTDAVTVAMVEAGEVNFSSGPYEDPDTNPFPNAMWLEHVFRSPAATYEGAYVEVSYAALAIPVLAGGLPPRRIHPRDDGLAGSSAPRLAPGHQSEQASNRRVGGYL